MHRYAAWVFLCTLFLAPTVTAAYAVNVTFYGPGAAGNMQGGMTAARNNPEGNNRIRTLDDLRTGASRYITLASASVMSRRWFCIGTVTYTSPQTRQTHTLENVIGYIHDTGCAFNGTCSCGWLPQYCSGRARPDKMDVPLGNFTGWGASETMRFIVQNPNRAPRDWQEIDGLPTPGSTGGACGGQPRETNVPVAALYSPTSLQDRPPGLFTSGNTGLLGNNMFASQAFVPPQNSPYVTSQQELARIAAAQNGANQPFLPSTPPPSSSPGTPSPDSKSSAQLLVQPPNPRANQEVLVSWTSVGMRSPYCSITRDNTGEVFASGQEGTQKWSATSGSHTFAMTCQQPNGQPLGVTRTIVVP